MRYKTGARYPVIDAQTDGVERFHADAHLVAGGVVPEEAGGAELGWTIEMFPITEAQIHLSIARSKG